MRTVHLTRKLLRFIFGSLFLLYDFVLLEVLAFMLQGLVCRQKYPGGPVLLAMDESVHCGSNSHLQRERIMMALACIYLLVVGPAICNLSLTLNKMASPVLRYLPVFLLNRTTAYVALTTIDVISADHNTRKTVLSSLIMVALLGSTIVLQPVTGRGKRMNSFSVSLYAAALWCFVIVSPLRETMPLDSVVPFVMFVLALVLVAPVAYFVNMKRAKKFDCSHIVAATLQMCRNDDKAVDDVRADESPVMLVVAFSASSEPVERCKKALDVKHVYESAGQVKSFAPSHVRTQLRAELDQVGNCLSAIEAEAESDEISAIGLRGIHSAVATLAETINRMESRVHCKQQLQMLQLLAELSMGCTALRRHGILPLVVALLKYETLPCIEILSRCLHNSENKYTMTEALRHCGTLDTLVDLMCSTKQDGQPYVNDERAWAKLVELIRTIKLPSDFLVISHFNAPEARLETVFKIEKADRHSLRKKVLSFFFLPSRTPASTVIDFVFVEADLSDCTHSRVRAVRDKLISAVPVPTLVVAAQIPEQSTSDDVLEQLDGALADVPITLPTGDLSVEKILAGVTAGLESCLQFGQYPDKPVLRDQSSFRNDVVRRNTMLRQVNSEHEREHFHTGFERALHNTPLRRLFPASSPSEHSKPTARGTKIVPSASAEFTNISSDQRTEQPDGRRQLHSREAHRNQAIPLAAKGPSAPAEPVPGESVVILRRASLKYGSDVTPIRGGTSDCVVVGKCSRRASLQFGLDPNETPTPGSDSSVVVSVPVVPLDSQ